MNTPSVQINPEADSFVQNINAKRKSGPVSRKVLVDDRN
jgi:hypothetical protein